MKDYMQEEGETKKQPDAYASFEKVAKGDVNVYGFLVAFWNFEHVFDDLIDNSGWADNKKEQAWKALNEFQKNLLSNPFVQAYHAEFRTLFTSAIARQIGGDHIALDEKRKQHASATRCADIDILVHVAGLHGGWDDMIAVSKQRDIDKEEK
jgi:hypothetical protein